MKAKILAVTDGANNDSWLVVGGRVAAFLCQEENPKRALEALEGVLRALGVEVEVQSVKLPWLYNFVFAEDGGKVRRELGISTELEFEAETEALEWVLRHRPELLRV